MKKLIILIWVTALSMVLYAQDSTNKKSRLDKKLEKRQRINAMVKQEEEGILSFRKQNDFGIQLRTDGYGIFYELGRRTSPRFSNLYSIELTEIKSPKEDKLGAQNFFGNSYVYGKLNNFYQLKLGFGRQYILGQKGNKNGVAIIGSFQGGIAVGLLKPYFLDVVDSLGNVKTISYQQDTSAFLDPYSIQGGGGFTKGWNQVQIKPGLYIKTSLRFDFGRYNETVQAIEIGMSLEAYAQKIPIMLYNDPKQLFFQGHIAFVFGRRK